MNKHTLMVIIAAISASLFGFFLCFTLVANNVLQPSARYYAETQAYRMDIANLEGVRELFRQTLINNGIEVPKYIPEFAHIEANGVSIVVTSRQGESRYNWSEVFDTSEQAKRYLALLSSEMARFGALVEYPAIDRFGAEYYPMLWNFSVVIPPTLSTEDAVNIHDTLGALGAWNDIRDTSENWRH